ncbi:MAG: hypothetical protein FJX75_24545 [Armatimonadetes bacterium]|nr:hypothetical protein [Armatimonadota bacterium]
MREERFFGRRVTVTCREDTAGFLLPAEFVLGEDVVRIAEVLRQWHDSGFAGTSRRRTWLERRHRTHYRVRGEDGRIYDLYVDRTGARREWYLLRRAPRPQQPSGPPGGERTGT